MLKLKNCYYAALPNNIQQRWKPYLSLQEFRKGDQLDLDRVKGAIYFPITCVATLSVRSKRGDSTFLRFSGRNFVIGLANLLNSSSIGFEARICHTGYAFRLPVEVVKKDLPYTNPSGNLLTTNMVIMTERLSESAYCHLSHNSSQRLARVLLEASDNFPIEDGTSLTQDDLGKILGVRRETVAEKLESWTRMGIIRTKRARIEIAQRDRLEATSCDCFNLVEDWRGREFELWKNIAWPVD